MIAFHPIIFFVFGIFICCLKATGESKCETVVLFILRFYSSNILRYLLWFCSLVKMIAGSISYICHCFVCIDYYIYHYFVCIGYHICHCSLCIGYHIYHRFVCIGYHIYHCLVCIGNCNVTASVLMGAASIFTWFVLSITSTTFVPCTSQA